MRFQVTQVANGYMVTPAPDYARDTVYSNDSIHVFSTWQKASAWINEQFRKATK